MSLKARIEAVIYAAEEPVTLAQLASLFRDEALLSRAQRTAPQPDPEAPTEDALPADAVAIELTADTTAAPAPGSPVPDSPVPDSPPTESLDPEVPPIPSAQEEPTTAAADPVSELADSTATDSFPDGAPPPADSLADSASELREAPVAGREVPREAPSDEAPLDDEKKAARARDREVREEIRRLVDELIADYSAADRGLEIREVAGGFRLATRAEYHDAVRAFVKSLKPPMKLSLQALETLAVIAYKQPVTAPEIGEIRGVDSGGVLGSLVARKLITTAGRKQVIGRPILYKTTKEFLLRFGLRDLNELPSIEEFEKMATDLAESDLAESGLAEESSASQEQELPFVQNDIAEIEENETAEQSSAPDAEGDSPSAQGPHDPKEPAPPMNDPPPENPEPPIGEPPTEPDQAPTTEYDAASGEEHHS
jgi:segregation and condensation protein B